MFETRFWWTLAVVWFLLCSIWPHPTQAETDCANADPTGTLNKTVIDAYAGRPVGLSDFELTVDPQDNLGAVLLTSNTRDGNGEIVVARLNAGTGIFSDQRLLKRVATNYLGTSNFNGPEWVQKPSGELGILYSGPNGVHGIFRSTMSAQNEWGRFIYDVKGNAVRGKLPPALPNTTEGHYPTSSPPFLVSLYSQFNPSSGPPCNGTCIGFIDSPATTDIITAFLRIGLHTSHGPLNPNRDGYFFVNACNSSGECGIYEAAVNYDGGLKSGTVKKLVSSSALSGTMTAGRHPVTGDTLIFALDELDGNFKVGVWRQPAAGGILTLVGEIPVEENAHHFRTPNDNVKTLFLYQSEGNGTFTVPVTASGNSLVVGEKKLVHTITSSEEVIWLPFPDRWAFYYNYSTVDPVVFAGLQRCWFVP